MQQHTAQRTFASRLHSPVGLVTLHNVKAVPQSAWPTTTAVQIMIPTKEVKQVGPEAELWEALAEMDRDGVNQCPACGDAYPIVKRIQAHMGDRLRFVFRNFPLARVHQHAAHAAEAAEAAVE